MPGSGRGGAAASSERKQSRRKIGYGIDSVECRGEDVWRNLEESSPVLGEKEMEWWKSAVRCVGDDVMRG